jgi:hypothetical protein
MSSKYAINLDTQRLVLKSTAKYKKLAKLGRVKEIEEIDKKEPEPEPETEASKKTEASPEPAKKKTPDNNLDFDESKLQTKLADISTDMIKENLSKIVKSKKLTDDEMDTLIKKMLYEKLCIDKPDKKSKPKKKPVKKSKKSKFKIVEPSSSDSESDSSSDSD